MSLLTARARQYISRMAPSIEGSRGSDAIFNVAVALVRGFELPDAEASQLLAEWNQQHAVPPWSEKELRHKLSDARTNSRVASGYLLNSNKTQPVMPLAAKQKQEKQTKRERWPVFNPITLKGCTQIGKLRKICPGIVQGFNSLGYLAGAEVDGHRCYVIHERNFAQARRLDGKMFTIDGKDSKTKNLPGSEGRFIGWNTLGDSSVKILLVEGVIGMLEGMAAITLADVPGWTVMAATTGGTTFNAAELSRLRGRTIRIIPDNDEKGLASCAKLFGLLQGAGFNVSAYTLPDGNKDLGDVLENTAVLQEIFEMP